MPDEEKNDVDLERTALWCSLYIIADELDSGCVFSAQASAETVRKAARWIKDGQPAPEVGVGDVIELKRDFVGDLKDDLLLWSQEGPPAPFMFAKWAALLEHSMGLTEPFPE